MNAKYIPFFVLKNQQHQMTKKTEILWPVIVHAKIPFQKEFYYAFCIMSSLYKICTLQMITVPYAGLQIHIKWTLRIQLNLNRFIPIFALNGKNSSSATSLI